MDTIDVAIFKDNTVIEVLVFGVHNEDAEIQSFAEMLGGDSFQRLDFNQVVSDGAVVTSEKPTPDSTWDEANKTWTIPMATINPDVDESVISDELKAEYAAYLARQASDD